MCTLCNIAFRTNQYFLHSAEFGNERNTENKMIANMKNVPEFDEEFRAVRPGCESVVRRTIFVAHVSMGALVSNPRFT